MEPDFKLAAAALPVFDSDRVGPVCVFLHQGQQCRQPRDGSAAAGHDENDDVYDAPDVRLYRFCRTRGAGHLLDRTERSGYGAGYDSQQALWQDS